MFRPPGSFSGMGRKIWLTYAQETMLTRAARSPGEWQMEHDGCRDDLEEMAEHGLVETRRTRRVAGIAFRVPAGRLVLKLHDGHHMAI